jgi:hypothetical protein
MRRFLITLIFLILASALVVRGNFSLATEPEKETAVALANLTAQIGAQSILLQPADPFTPGEPSIWGGNGANDFCETATAVQFSETAIGGVTDNIHSFTESPTDPILNCMWGNPTRPQGYRTAWYKFTAQTNAVVTINTATSNYDTVVGVYQPTDTSLPCSTLTAVACNDDFSGFSSRLTFAIAANQTYYVVIASWSGSSSGAMNLNIFMEPSPISSEWATMGNQPLLQRTHMASVSVQNQIYAIGGQTNYNIQVPEISNLTTRYNPAANSATPLATIPGGGLTNHTAVHLDGRIYVPGGDSGLTNSFDTTHWVYNIAGNFWSSTAAAAPGVGWSQAVARPNGTGYYLLGGIQSKPVFTSTAQVTNNVWLYLPESNSWLDNPPEMTSPRYGHTAVALGDRVCVVGGINDQNQLLSGGECLAPFSTWQPIPSLNIPRYGADSIVGADGRWYVFGGLDASSRAVASVEVYDPTRPSLGWSLMSVPYDLVAPSSSQARAFPAGELADQHLYVMGGNDTTNYFTTPLVQRLTVAAETLFLPIVPKIGNVLPNDTFAAAWQLGFNTWYNFNFTTPYDFYDAYFIDLPAFSGIMVQLAGIPSGSNYDLYVYNNNKLLWGSSTNGGNLNETAPLTLEPGRYYILVVRTQGPADGSSYLLSVAR